MGTPQWLYQGRLKLRSLFRRSAVERELAEEMAFHLEQQRLELLAQGATETEAKQAAQRAFGSLAQRQEECRDSRGFTPLDGLWQDVRQSLRSLRRSPGFTAIAILSLALGIGANSALFSVVNAVLLRPLPLPGADRLLAINEFKQAQPNGSNPPRLADWQAQCTSFTAIAGSYSEGLVLSGDGSPVRLNALRIGGDWLGVLGIQPKLGRPFTTGELRGEGPGVILLSHALWQQRFGGSPSAIGRTMTLGGIPFTIIGVMPPGSLYPGDIGVWAPMPSSIQQVDRRAGFLGIVGRLRPERTRQQAQAELTAAAARLAAQYPQSDAGLSVQAIPLQNEVVRDARTPLLILLGVAGVVLLAACLNLTALLLGRAVARQRDAAIRVALGAGRIRLMRLFLTESLLIALFGGLLGGLLAAAGLPLLTSILPANLPHAGLIHLDTRVLGFSLFVTLCAGLLTGLVPAWRAARTASGPGMKESGGAVSNRAPRQYVLPLLIVTEVMLSLLLLVGAALLTRTFLRLTAEPLGFQPEHVVTVGIDFPWDTPSAKLHSFTQQVLDRLAAAPGVREVGVVDRLPFGGGSQGSEFIRRDRPLLAGAIPDKISLRAASPGYFAVLGIPLTSGQIYRPRAQGEGLRTTVVNQTLARRFFGDESPIGKFVTFRAGPQPRWLQIVGVVGDVRQDTTQPVPPEAYVLPQDTFWPLANFVVKAQGEREPLLHSIREAVRQVDPLQPIDRLGLLTDAVSHAHDQPRLRFWLLSGFALVALLLAAIGVYGLLSQQVAQRTQEIGVRLALGAQPKDVLWESLRQGLALAGAGLLLGIAGAVALSRFLSSFLYNVPPTDPLAFISATVVLLGAATLASYLPARRAARVDPLVALRHE